MFALRVLVADDDATVRKSLSSLVEPLGNIEICEEASDGRQALEKSKTLEPDIAILNTHLPVLDGLDTPRAMKKLFPQMPIMMLSELQDPQVTQAVKGAGANGYVSPRAEPAILCSAMDAALHREFYFPA